MHLSQADDYVTETFDLVAEPPAQLVTYQPTMPTAGATPSILDSIVSFGQKLAPALLSMKQQSDLNAINLERAKKGLPPLNTAQYTAQSAPQVRFGMTDDTQKLVMIGLAGAALVALLMFARR